MERLLFTCLRTTLLFLLTGTMWAPAWAQIDSLSPVSASLDSLLNQRINTTVKLAQSISEIPASLTIIAKEDIQNYGYNDVSELLNAVREIYLSNDRNYGYIGIRGFCRPNDYNNRIAFMVNGIVQNDNIWGGNPLENDSHGLNLDDVERVEIIRGPASALYGNYPMLGIINVITQSGKTQDGNKLSVETGSYGKIQASGAYGKVLKNGIDMHVGVRAGSIAGQNLYYAAYDDSSTNFGVADHTNSAKFYGLNARISLRAWTFKVLHTWRDAHVPTGSFGTIFNDPTFHVVDGHLSLDLSYGREIARRAKFFGRSYFNRYGYRGYYPYPSPIGLDNEVTEGLWGGLEGRLIWDISTTNRLLVGIEGRGNFKTSYRTMYNNIEQFNGSFPYYTYGIYLQDEWQPWKKLNISGGLRFDYLYLGNIALTPRVAVNYFVGKKTTLKALYGEAFKAPTVYEVEISNGNPAVGDYRLRPERTQSIELIGEQRIAKHLNVVGSLYNSQMYRLIESVTLADSTQQYQNIQKAGGYGVSAELNGRLKDGLNFYLSYSFARMQNVADGTWLTNSPRHLAKGGVSFPLLRYFRLSPEAVFQSGRKTVSNLETSAFFLSNVNVIFAPKFKEKAKFASHFQLSFKIRNILNTAYEYPAGFEHKQAFIQQNGRNYNLKIQFSFD